MLCVSGARHEDDRAGTEQGVADSSFNVFHSVSFCEFPGLPALYADGNQSNDLLGKRLHDG